MRGHRGGQKARRGLGEGGESAERSCSSAAGGCDALKRPMCRLRLLWRRRLCREMSDVQTLDTIAAPAVTTTGTTTVNKYSPSYIMDVNTVFISFPTADMDVQQCAGDTRSGSGRTRPRTRARSGRRCGAHRKGRRGGWQVTRLEAGEVTLLDDLMAVGIDQVRGGVLLHRRVGE